MSKGYTPFVVLSFALCLHEVLRSCLVGGKKEVGERRHENVEERDVPGRAWPPSLQIPGYPSCFTLRNL